MIVSRRGVTWDVDAPDDFWSTLWLDGWEEFTLDVVDRFAREDATLVDVGAWVGPVSLWGARRGPVLAVEPDPVARDFLRRNVTENAPERVWIAGCAVDDLTGTSFILPHSEVADDWGTSMTGLSDHGLEVRAYTLPDLLYVYSIDGPVSLVKMDIEGGECDVLEHAAPYCAEHGIPLLVAMHEPWWTRPVDPAWFDGFTSVEGDMHGWGQLLCV